MTITNVPCSNALAGMKHSNRGTPAILEPVGECQSSLCRSGNADRPCAGRGLNPRPESSTPAEYSPAIPNSERHPPEVNLLIDSYFLSAIPLLSRGWIVPVGGSTPDRLRGFPQKKPPTARGHRRFWEETGQAKAIRDKRAGRHKRTPEARAALGNADPVAGKTPRKEVVQPQVLLRLPCYDFTPVTRHTLVSVPPEGLNSPLLASPASMV